MWMPISWISLIFSALKLRESKKKVRNWEKGTTKVLNKSKVFIKQSQLTFHLQLQQPYKRSPAHIMSSTYVLGGQSASAGLSWKPAHRVAARPVSVVTDFYQQREAFSTEVDRGPFLQIPSSHHSLLTSSKPSLSGCFLGTGMYLEGITGEFRTTQWEGGWMQKWFKWYTETYAERYH